VGTTDAWRAVDARRGRPPDAAGWAWVSTTLDAALVRQAQRGDHEAFEAMVHASVDRLFALATLMTRDPSLAEDAVQDAFARAWRDLPRLREVERIGGWLTRLTVNATYDVLRRRKHVSQALPLEHASTVAGAATNPIDAIVLAEAFGRLPVEQRAVIVLHYYQGLPLDDVAATLGVPPGTVRSRLHVALRSMRSWLGRADLPGEVVRIGG